MAEDEYGTDRGDARTSVRDEFTPPIAPPAGTRPPSSPGSGGVMCPECGVAVAPGYPKCPKCHAGLPVLPSPLARMSTARPEPVGGTSVAGDRNHAWLLGVLAAVVVVGVVIYLATAGGDDPLPAAAVPGEGGLQDGDGDGEGDGASEDGDEGGRVGDSRRGVGAEPEFEPLEDPEPLPAGDPDALIEVRAQLQVAKLWSTVFVDPDDGEIAVIESDQCDDPEMKPLVERMTGALDDAGFAKVTCTSKFGATVFENQWRKLATEANDTGGAPGAE